MFVSMSEHPCRLSKTLLDGPDLKGKREERRVNKFEPSKTILDGLNGCSETDAWCPPGTQNLFYWKHSHKAKPDEPWVIGIPANLLRRGIILPLILLQTNKHNLSRRRWSILEGDIYPMGHAIQIV